MGTPMAVHSIKAGHQLFVFSLGKKPEAIASSGATHCLSARDTAARADIVIIMVPDTPDVEDSLFGEAGIAAGLKASIGEATSRAPKVLVDMSSVSAIATKKFA